MSNLIIIFSEHTIVVILDGQVAALSGSFSIYLHCQTKLVFLPILQALATSSPPKLGHQPTAISDNPKAPEYNIPSRAEEFLVAFLKATERFLLSPTSN